MTNPHPLEIELKLALPQQQVEAFRKRMARRRSEPVEQELVTRYFDTPDFALSAQGVALRVRRIGRRWLQTLKTEGERRGGLSKRAEYEMAIARNQPDWSRFPAEALDRVPEALRAQLVPVFETRFIRTAWLIRGRGESEIEVALDIGEVRAAERSQPICEIELELKAGQPDALFALALDWAGQFDCLPLDVSKAERGVRLAHGMEAAPVKFAPLALDAAMSVEDGFAASCQACLTQLQANLPGVLGSDDIEYVHQARVALRRLRAALRLFRRACALPDELMEGLRTLADALGPARDWDVLCSETLPDIAPHFPDEAGWQQGVGVVETQREAVRVAMRASMSKAQPGAWLLAFHRWLLQRGWQDATEAQRVIQASPLKRWARKSLQKGHRRIVRGAKDFAQQQAAQRHALRIAIKRQRYAAEFFQALFKGRRQVCYLSALESLQDSLGQANDAQVAQELLMQLEGEGGRMRLFVLGWLAARQADGATCQIEKHLKNFMKCPPCW